MLLYESKTSQPFTKQRYGERDVRRVLLVVDPYRMTQTHARIEIRNQAQREQTTALPVGTAALHAGPMNSMLVFMELCFVPC